MEHVVFYPTVGDAPGFRRFGALDEAVRFVEHLRNEEGVADVTLHALTEVPLAFKAWYRVEVPAGEAASPVAPSLEEVDSATFEIPAPSLPGDFVQEHEIPVVAVSANGDRGLGYFAG